MSKGDIGSVVDTLEFDTTQGSYPHVVHVSGDIFAIAYQGTSNDGFVVTFTIDKAGAIGAATIDSQQFNAGGTNGREPVMRQVSGTTYAILYDGRTITSGGTGPLRIATLTINPDGTIDDTILDDEALGPATKAPKDLINISGSVFAVAYEDGGIGNGVRILTRSITALGIIDAADIDLLEIDATGSFGTSIVQVSGTMYAVAYGQFPGGGRGQVVTTVVIENDGQIAAAITATRLFVLGRSGTNQTTEILKIFGTTYAIAYVDTDEDGRVTTITISDAGAITSTTIDTLEFETTLALNLDFIQIAGNLYAVVYSGVGVDGFVKTFQIDNVGNIGLVLSTLEFDTADTDDPTIALVPDSDDHVAIAYTGVLADGFVKTVGVTTLLAGYIWIEGEAFHYVDENTVERFVIGARDDHAPSEAISGWLGF